MSDATEQREIIEESPYAAHIDALLDRFSALVEHAQTIAFPPLRKGVTAPPDMTGWSKRRRIAFTISSPLPTTLTVETVERFCWVLLIWIVVSTYWWNLAGLVADLTFGAPQPTLPESEAPLWAEIIAWPLLLLIVISPFVAYLRWGEFFRDQRYPSIWRFVLAAAFIMIVVSSPYWLLVPEYRMQFPSLLLRDRVKLILFVLNYLVFVIPAGTFYYMFAIDILVLGVRLPGMILQYLWSAHNPLSRELVRKLALEPIPTSQSEGKKWRLIELTKAELELLYRWAAANREGTDKRLLPTVVLFGVLGVFADTQAFSDAIDRVLIWLSRSPAIIAGKDARPLLSVMGRFLAFGIVLALGILSIYTLLLLFRNLVTQSLIVEASVVAMYACEQQNSDSGPETAAGPKGFWERLLSLLWKR